MKRNKILELFFPWKCPFCGEILHIKEGEICGKCKDEISYIHEPICMKCGKPIEDEREEYCYDCKRREHQFCEGRSIWVHKPPVSEAIYRFKYHGIGCYGNMFADELGKYYKEYLYEKNVELILPIPLHKRRKRMRGYNQSEIVAKELSKKTGIPCDATVLVRKKYTMPQKQLDDVERKKNITGAFAVVKDISGKNVVLIDDIYTTGSTIDEAAETLRNSGVSNVYFLTISIGQGF